VLAAARRTPDFELPTVLRLPLEPLSRSEIAAWARELLGLSTWTSSMP